MAIKAAIFDLDGTLLDSMHIWSNLCNEFLHAHGIAENIDLDGKLGVLSIRSALTYILDNYPLDTDLDTACMETWQIVENFYRNEVTLKQGVMRLLNELEAYRIPAGIITATETGLVKHALHRVGLTEYFAEVLSCADLQTSKRKPEVFMMLADKFGAKPGEIMVFEDALYAAETAKNAGFNVAAVYDPSERNSAVLKKTADYYCRSWEDFPLHLLH